MTDRVTVDEYLSELSSNSVREYMAIERRMKEREIETAVRKVIQNDIAQLEAKNAKLESRIQELEKHLSQ